MKRAPWCCYIPDDQQEAARRGADVPGCGKEAQFDIVPASGEPDLSTQACRDHVGALLGPGAHYVCPIERAET